MDHTGCGKWMSKVGAPWSTYCFCPFFAVFSEAIEPVGWVMFWTKIISEELHDMQKHIFWFEEIVVLGWWNLKTREHLGNTWVWTEKMISFSSSACGLIPKTKIFAPCVISGWGAKALMHSEFDVWISLKIFNLWRKQFDAHVERWGCPFVGTFLTAYYTVARCKASASARRACSCISHCGKCRHEPWRNALHNLRLTQFAFFPLLSTSFWPVTTPNPSW